MKFHLASLKSYICVYLILSTNQVIGIDRNQDLNISMNNHIFKYIKDVMKIYEKIKVFGRINIILQLQQKQTHELKHP